MPESSSTRSDRAALIVAILFALFCLCFAAMAQTPPQPSSEQVAAGYYQSVTPTYASGIRVPLNLDINGNLDVNCVVGCAGGTFNNNADTVATSATNGQAASWPYVWNGTSWDRLYGDKTNGAFVNVKTSVLPTGAATAAGLTTINTTLGTPMQTAGGSVTANAGTNLNTSLLALEAGGNLAQLVTDSGAPGAVACATDTGSCNFNQLFQRLAQRLTTINTTLGSPLQAGGTVTANQGGTWTVQPGNTANTTAWKVDGSAVTQPVSGTVTTAPPSNASTNIAQINGVTPLMGNGVTGTGSHRATISSDNTAIANWGQGATGSAVPAGAVYAAGIGTSNLTGITVCDSYTPFSFSSSSAQKIVSKVASKKVYICAINLVVAAATNIALIEGTKVTNECDTSTAGMAGGTTAATGWNLAANGGLTQGSGLGVIIKTANANFDVCLLASAANQVSGGISWTQNP